MTFWYKLAILAVIIAIYTGGVWQVKGWKDELATQADLSNQEAMLMGRCKDNQAITKEANDAISKDFSAIDYHFNALSMQPNACVLVSPPGPANLPAAGERPVRPVRLNRRWLHKHNAYCKAYKAEFQRLNEFVDRTWKANGQ